MGCLGELCLWEYLEDGLQSVCMIALKPNGEGVKEGRTSFLFLHMVQVPKATQTVSAYSMTFVFLQEMIQQEVQRSEIGHELQAQGKSPLHWVVALTHTVI